jgi:hypothetical protein
MTMFRQAPLPLFMAIVLAPTFGQAQEEAKVCSAENADLASISQKYKPEFDKISDDGQKLGDDSKDKHDLSIDMDVTFKEQHWIFDLPSVTVRDQKLIFGVPQVTMKTNDLSFDLPVTKLVNKKVGQKPEVYCDTHTVIPKCTTKWTDIIIGVPEVSMETKHIKMDIPEVAMKNTQIVMGIPEFKMQRQDWYVKIPEFTLKKIEIAGAPIYNSYEKQGKELEITSRGI